MDNIIVRGARENNLKNIDITLPKNKLIVMTGLSGSGKSSLAFDTIYAEGERRYVESLSSYARQFLGNSNKPEVDSIEGLSPSISIDQKSTNNNPRSTVGTVTEIYDYLRLLFARIGTPYCPEHHIPITSSSVEEIVNKLLEFEIGTKMIIYSPIVNGDKGTQADLFNELRKDGFVRARVNGETLDLSEEISLDKNTRSNIDIVIDRLVLKEDIRSRLFEAIELATNKANGKVLIDVLGDKEYIFSTKYACPKCNYSLPELEPRLFSFNSPFGACPECNGLGTKLKIDPELIVPDKSKSLNQNCIVTMSDDLESIDMKKLEVVCKKYNIDMNEPFSNLSDRKKNIIFYGSPDIINFKIQTKSGNTMTSLNYYEGVINALERRYIETSSDWIREWLGKFMIEFDCPVCHGARLSESVLNILINGRNINDITNMSIKELNNWLNNLELTKEQELIAGLLINEIKNRTSFLFNVGLGYLTLSRKAGTLSGGESQRIRLATQIGSRLTGVLYVLDEPSIGLHQKDNEKLINSLLEMRDLGNTLIVVEHDTDTMLAADYLVDIGPGAGDLGGEVVAAGTPKEVMENKNSITGAYLSGRMKIDVPKKRRKANLKNTIDILGANANNLKNIDVSIPKGIFTCVTGVSGSGRSLLSLWNMKMTL